MTQTMDSGLYSVSKQSALKFLNFQFLYHDTHTILTVLVISHFLVTSSSQQILIWNSPLYSTSYSRDYNNFYPFDWPYFIPPHCIYTVSELLLLFLVYTANIINLKASALPYSIFAASIGGSLGPNSTIKDRTDPFCPYKKIYQPHCSTSIGTFFTPKLICILFVQNPLIKNLCFLTRVLGNRHLKNTFNLPGSVPDIL